MLCKKCTIGLRGSGLTQDMIARMKIKKIIMSIPISKTRPRARMKFFKKSTLSPDINKL